ncbi:HAD family hydrolase [Mangrovactinospora gilvigrisea]|uniref:HAD family hydrolase n=1 Tax=Mangrovactinospora gilvigrisea TaxID=1428644 RepID=A0A1J7B9B7_9ACTN|nr:HAD-IIA family hydrolase [Mangrovactinospora gilvigrisea]OIV35243.1 HAD family hydrolase [Mangrovactinospora gilvigrisea]
MTARLPKGCARPLATEYDTALLDLDGVVYAGRAAIPHAVAALAGARGEGMRLAYVTNNASRPPRAVSEHLTELGIPTAPTDVVNSAQATARLVAERVPEGAAVLVVGGEGLLEALRERGLVPVRSLDDEPAAVVQGFAPDVDWNQLAEAAFAVRQGLPWVASNADLTIPTGRGIAPGNGALVETVRIATGRTPEVAGKPEPPMHRESMLRTGARRALVVGDRLDTDIEGAVRGGVDSLLVFTGVTDAAGAVTAPEGRRPVYLAEDLRGLLVAHPELMPGEEPGAFGCGGWTAGVRDAALWLDGEGERIDALRALCAAAWAAAEAPGGVDKAVARAGF